MGYEHMDVSGDAGVGAEGATLAEAMAEAALGMYALMTPPEGVRPAVEQDVAVGREGVEELAVAWLGELIYLFDARGFVGREVEVLECDETHIRARVRGETFDPGRHELGVHVKAATYHGLSVRRLPGGAYRIEVILDI